MTTAPPVRLPLIRPDIAFEEVEEGFREVFQSGALTRGPYLERFEKALAERVGAAHAVAVTSATTALHLALVAQGIGPGDEVLVSDFTFPATGNVVVQTGATPIFVDCLPGRFELDVDHAASLVTSRTRAILPVDPFGRPADLAAIESLARAHDLFVLEDAACAIGSTFQGRACGAWKDAAAFSFHPRKLLTTGEGGAVTTNDPELAERMRLLRSHGATVVHGRTAFVTHGFNYRMSELQAVMGLAQLGRLDLIIEDRCATATLYERLLRGIPGVTLVDVDPRTRVNHQSFVVLLDDADRETVCRVLAERGIETTLGTYAMHAQPAFGGPAGMAAGDLPHSWSAQERSLTLPLVPRMPEEDVVRVVEALRDAVDA